MQSHVIELVIPMYIVIMAYGGNPYVRLTQKG